MYHRLSLKFQASSSEYSCPGPRIIGSDEMFNNFPFLDTKYKWGVVVYDGEMDDSRLLMETMLTSTQASYIPGMKGSNILNYARFDGFVKDSSGKIVGVEFFDKVNQKTMKIKAKYVVNATGNFTDKIRKLDDPNCGRRVIHALGTHIMLDRAFCSRDMGILIPKTSDGRVLFCIPWLNGTTVGTTDVIMDEPAIHPTPTPQCMEFLSKETSNLFPIFKDKKVDEYIKSKWSGIRPLVLKNEQELGDTTETHSGKDVARTHVILESTSGLISVVGGKWTIYRRMGEETLLHILRKTQPDLKEIPHEQSTRNLRLIGDYRAGVAGKHLTGKRTKQHDQYLDPIIEKLTQKYGSLGVPMLNHLARCYGIRSLDILSMIDRDPKLAEKIHPKHEVSRAEIIYQIRNEMVVNVFDLLLRRNRLAFLDKEATLQVMPTVIDLLGNEMNWSVTQKESNLEQAKEIFKNLEF
jgi:glycerol-3-phosphate dehydrogenase